MANSVEYGLASSVWTENLKRAHRVAQEIKSGTVWVNTWLKVHFPSPCSCPFPILTWHQRDLRVPFGGMKHSGIGREGGDHSIDFYTEQKTICISL